MVKNCLQSICCSPDMLLAILRREKEKKKYAILINMHTGILIASPCRFHIPPFFLHLKTIIFNRGFCNQKSLCSYQYRQEIERHIFRSAEASTTRWALFYPLAIFLQLSVFFLFFLFYGGFPGFLELQCKNQEPQKELRSNPRCNRNC